MLIAQVTDTHIQAGGRPALGVVDTAGCLAACVAHLNAMDPRPNLVLMTGDLVHAGEAAEYATFRDIISDLAMPVYLVPGNHDARDPLRAAFPDHAYLPREGFLHYAVEDWPLRLIGLDTLVEGRSGGEMCAERLVWLDATLAEQPEAPTLLFMHHPPFLTGIRHMDATNCANGAALGAVVRRHPQVVRLLCGHVHRAVQVAWNGILASIAPSPAHAVTFDLTPDAPSCFTLEPPSCQLLHVAEDGSLVAHLTSVGTFEGPYSFRSPPSPPAE